ncbi:MAG: OmpH family outer membrane protein [Granulosicoccus sp.]
MEQQFSLEDSLRGQILNIFFQTRALLLPCTVIVAMAILAMPWAAFAQSDTTNDSSKDRRVNLSRVGFVDIPYLIDRAPQAVEAEQRLEAEFAPRQAELEVQRAELASMAAKLADASLELAEAELTQLDRETRGLERRIKRSEQDFREELNIQKNNEFKKVRILVLEAIAEFGEQQDYDLIVSDGVLYANKRIDVTERILESLVRENARLQSAN